MSTVRQHGLFHFWFELKIQTLFYTLIHVPYYYDLNMKINVNKNIFLEKLTLASHFMSSRLGSSTTLQGVLLTFEKDKLFFYATNLNSYYKSQTAIEGDTKNDSIIVEPKKIIDFINLLKPGDIILEVGDKALRIHQEKNRGAFSVIRADDFPQPPKITADKQTLESGVLSGDLPLVIFTAAKDESRPVLSAINFLSIDNMLSMVSTDGFRLSLIKTQNKMMFPAMLVPAEFMAEMVRRMGIVKKIEFAYSKEESAVLFKIGDNEFYSRLIDGEFPPFEKVIPAETKTTVVLDREDFLVHVKMASILARDQSSIIICEFKKNEVTIKPKIEGADDSGVTQEAKIEGEDQRVAFNYRFLLDLLNNVDGQDIEIEILRSDAPVVFKLKKKPGFTHIIMPVRIQE